MRWNTRLAQYVLPVSSSSRVSIRRDQAPGDNPLNVLSARKFTGLYQTDSGFQETIHLASLQIERCHFLTLNFCQVVAAVELIQFLLNFCLSFAGGALSRCLVTTFIRERLAESSMIFSRWDVLCASVHWAARVNGLGRHNLNQFWLDIRGSPSWNLGRCYCLTVNLLIVNAQLA